jgi:hypothetical protein
MIITAAPAEKAVTTRNARHVVRFAGIVPSEDVGSFGGAARAGSVGRGWSAAGGFFRFLLAMAFARWRSGKKPQSRYNPSFRDNRAAPRGRRSGCQ